MRPVPLESAASEPPAVPRLTARPLVHLVGTYLVARCLVIGTAALSRAALVQGSYGKTTRSWLDRFVTWDANWYLEIATRGYRFDPQGESSVAFYPLYPLLIRGLWRCGLDPEIAGYAVSHAALFGAAVFLWRLAAWETRSAPTASLAVTFLLLSPGAMWFGMIYTESLFLLTTLGCLYAARRGRWLEAAAWGYAAAITRTPGLLLAGFLGLEAAQQWRGRNAPGAVKGPPARAGNPPLVRMGLAVAAPMLGQLTFLIFLQVAFGDWHAQQRTMTAGWFAAGPRWPWTALIQEWNENEPIFTLLADPVLLVVVLAGVASFWSLRRWGYPALVLALTTLYLVSTNGESLLRYLSTAAPVYLVLAQAARRSRLLETAVISFSVAMLVLVTVLLANGYRII